MKFHSNKFLNNFRLVNRLDCITNILYTECKTQYFIFRFYSEIFRFLRVNYTDDNWYKCVVISVPFHLKYIQRWHFAAGNILSFRSVLYERTTRGVPTHDGINNLPQLDRATAFHLRFGPRPQLEARPNVLLPSNFQINLRYVWWFNRTDGIITYIV